jgi:hypothetical protein
VARHPFPEERIDHRVSAAFAREHVVADEGGDYVQHIHVARAEGRAFPKRSDPDDSRPFFDNLGRIRYYRQVRLEARSTDPRRDGAESLALLRGLLG